MPARNGMAFVVVTHQHPGHTSLLPELLGKHTEMTVMAARDGQRVAPNCVYLSSPAHNLAMRHGALYSSESKPHNGLDLPIDHFFRSLADDQGERAVGIILSGTGTDGTLGLKAIKGAAGMTMTLAQEPGSAKYAGMPESAIATGLVDYVVRPSQMPALLMTYAKGAYLPPLPTVSPAEGHRPEALQKILQLLRDRTGHSFLAYKSATIHRRIERRMNVHQIKSLPRYLRHVQGQSPRTGTVVPGVVDRRDQFFPRPRGVCGAREPGPAGIACSQSSGRRDSKQFVRVWVPGCSTGEEALFRRQFYCGKSWRKPYGDRKLSLQIFGTDLDR